MADKKRTYLVKNPHALPRTIPIVTVEQKQYYEGDQFSTPADVAWLVEQGYIEEIR